MSTPAKRPAKQLVRKLRWLGPILLVAGGNCGLCLWPLANTVKYRLFGLSMEANIAVASGIILLAGLGWAGADGIRAGTLRLERDEYRQRAETAEGAVQAAAEAAALALEEHLGFMSLQLGFKVSERFSLYRVDTVRGCFVRVARYSLNPDLRIGGREEIQLAEGVLGLAFRGGSHRATLQFRSVPDWHREQSRAGLQSTTRIVALRMRSAEYAGFALLDPATNSFGAVLMCESENLAGLGRFTVLEKAVRDREATVMRTLAALETARALRDGGAE